MVNKEEEKEVTSFDKIKRIVMFLLVLIVGITIFCQLPKGTINEVGKIAFTSPFIYIEIFLCLVSFIAFFWLLIKVQIPSVFGGAKGKEESDENIRKLKSFFRLNKKEDKIQPIINQVDLKEEAQSKEVKK